MKNQFYGIGLLILVSIGFMTCDKPESRQFGIFKVLDNDLTIEMEGTINSKSLDNFNELLESYPNINLVNIVECDGSSDDEINLQLSAKVYQQGIQTHLLDDGLIASGGTDFFLAGTKRTIGSNTKIGVHSWSDGSSEATDFPVGDSKHQPYIDYYVSVGFTTQEAKDFYYFTINAATASNIHWMTASEITQYKILKN
ncbi:MAG: hypothetical protein GY810_03955 [Aureispira sp.]|nr:hypothetical protein [Aureispira sp.]